MPKVLRWKTPQPELPERPSNRVGTTCDRDWDDRVLQGEVLKDRYFGSFRLRVLMVGMDSMDSMDVTF